MWGVLHRSRLALMSDRECRMLIADLQAMNITKHVFALFTLPLSPGALIKMRAADACYRKRTSRETVKKAIKAIEDCRATGADNADATIADELAAIMPAGPEVVHDSLWIEHLREEVASVVTDFSRMARVWDDAWLASSRTGDWIWRREDTPRTSDVSKAPVTAANDDDDDDDAMRVGDDEEEEPEDPYDCLVGAGLLTRVGESLFVPTEIANIVRDAQSMLAGNSGLILVEGRIEHALRLAEQMYTDLREPFPTRSMHMVFTATHASAAYARTQTQADIYVITDDSAVWPEPVTEAGLLIVDAAHAIPMATWPFIMRYYERSISIRTCIVCGCGTTPTQSMYSKVVPSIFSAMYQSNIGTAARVSYLPGITADVLTSASTEPVDVPSGPTIRVMALFSQTDVGDNGRAPEESNAAVNRMRTALSALCDGVSDTDRPIVLFDRASALYAVHGRATKVEDFARLGIALRPGMAVVQMDGGQRTVSNVYLRHIDGGLVEMPEVSTASRARCAIFYRLVGHIPGSDALSLLERPLAPIAPVAASKCKFAPTRNVALFVTGWSVAASLLSTGIYLATEKLMIFMPEKSIPAPVIRMPHMTENIIDAVPMHVSNALQIDNHVDE
jgi:hypothetical protein